LNPDSKGVPSIVKDMSENKDIIRMIEEDYMKPFNISYIEDAVSEDKIPVIMTGSPKACGFNTKADFLTYHPEYVETTKWNECQILFTDDLDSDSSKMQKAKKLGITIKKYN
jgi:hypothetical protein